MKNQRTSSGITRRNFLKGLAGIACAGIIAGGSLAGCATSGSNGSFFGNYGDLSSSKEVTESFANYEPKADHNYFIAGAKKDSPDVILGLNGQYTIANPKSWHPVEPNTLQELVTNMQDKASESSNIPYGANVLDHNNKDIGDWYSTTNTTTIKLKDGKRVIIYAPMAGTGGSGGDSSGGGGCFTPETPILMSDDSYKPIKKILIGDEVKSFDFQTNQSTSSKVIALFKFQKTEHLVINELEVTKTHPFCTGKGEWKEAGMLKVGDILIGEDNKEIEIETIEKVQKDVTVHNFTVDGTHNYFVSNGKENFLVHNKGGGGSG